MSHTVALVQARMSSSRFQGKVLQELGGMPMIVFMLQRVRLARTLDQVAVVTSTDASDDVLAESLERHRIAVFRGDLHDVLARYKAAAEHFEASEVVRLTGDCPLIEPNIIDAVVSTRRARDADYCSNIDPPSFPDGLDVECFTMHALVAAFEKATQAPEREHVTLWMRSPQAGIRRENVRALADLSHLRLTVDYPDDLLAIRRIVSEWGTRAAAPDLYDILRCLARDPEITTLNVHARDEGLAKSLEVAR